MKDDVKQVKKGGGGGKKGGGKKKAGGAGNGGAISAKIKVLTHHDLARAAEAQICRGIYLTMLGLAMRGQYRRPVYPAELQGAVTRWNMRFAGISFKNTLPVSVSYDQFKKFRGDDVRSAGSGDALLKQAAEAYTLAKQKVESALRSRGDGISEPEAAWLNSLMKVSVANTLSLDKVKDEKKPLDIDLDWGTCTYHPIVTLKVKTL